MPLSRPRDRHRIHAPVFSTMSICTGWGMGWLTYPAQVELEHARNPCRRRGTMASCQKHPVTDADQPIVRAARINR